MIFLTPVIAELVFFSIFYYLVVMNPYSITFFEKLFTGSRFSSSRYVLAFLLVCMVPCYHSKTSAYVSDRFTVYVYAAQIQGLCQLTSRRRIYFNTKGLSQYAVFE